jgi:hypothetical protein
MTPRSEHRRHRHPDYPENRCGVQVIVVWNGNGAAHYQQRGMRVRKCRTCHRPIKAKDLK